MFVTKGALVKLTGALIALQYEKPSAEDLASTEVLVEVHACALSTVDYAIAQTALGNATATIEAKVQPLRPPTLPGHWLSGNIVACGKEAAGRFVVRGLGYCRTRHEIHLSCSVDVCDFA